MSSFSIKRLVGMASATHHQLVCPYFWLVHSCCITICYNIPIFCWWSHPNSGWLNPYPSSVGPWYPYIQSQSAAWSMAILPFEKSQRTKELHPHQGVIVMATRCPAIEPRPLVGAGAPARWSCYDSTQPEWQSTWTASRQACAWNGKGTHWLQGAALPQPVVKPFWHPFDYRYPMISIALIYTWRFPKSWG